MEFVGLSMIMKRKFHRREFMVFNGSTILVRFKFNDFLKKGGIDKSRQTSLEVIP